jgi:hypothetical protein
VGEPGVGTPRPPGRQQCPSPQSSSASMTKTTMPPSRPVVSECGDTRQGFPAWWRGAGRINSLGQLFLVLAVPVLALYNLGSSPRTWHDEGGAMSIAKTLAREGAYAIRSSEGYQTYGSVQSVGPTVIVPVAASFRLFGVGPVQGRMVMAGYLMRVSCFSICSSSISSSARPPSCRRYCCWRRPRPIFCTGGARYLARVPRSLSSRQVAS